MDTNLSDKIKQLIQLREEIILATVDFEKVTENLCPLQELHYELSAILFGIGRYSWQCGFCNYEQGM